MSRKYANLLRDQECCIPGCAEKVGKHGARKMCQPHYNLWRRKNGTQGRCSVDGCDRLAVGHRLCERHCAILKRNGDPLVLKRYFKSELREKYPSEYNIWKTMRQRCLNPKSQVYRHYGGRGIKVCDRWLEKPCGFDNFIQDIGPRPEGVTSGGRAVYSLDRIDVNGDYCPENCRWTTQKEQVRNRRPKAI